MKIRRAMGLAPVKIIRAYGKAASLTAAF